MEWNVRLPVQLLTRGRDHKVVEFTTTCAIGAYHHYSCEFEHFQFSRGRDHLVVGFTTTCAICVSPLKVEVRTPFMTRYN